MFEIQADGKVIGWTVFEFGDPPMGAVFGRFVPVEAFAEFVAKTPVSGASTGLFRSWSGLIAVTADGVVLDGVTVAVSLVEPTSMEGGADIEVSAEAIPYPLYEKLFAHHVAEYEARFPSQQ